MMEYWNDGMNGKNGMVENWNNGIMQQKYQNSRTLK